MRSKRFLLPSVGLATACALSVLSASEALAQDTRDVQERWDTFSADVTVRHRRITADGSSIGTETPPLRYRWERSETPAGWKTIMTVQPPAASEQRAMGRPQDPRFDIARVEDDGDGTAPRVFNRLDQRIELPGGTLNPLASARHLLPETARLAAEDRAPALAPTSGRNWVDGVVADPAKTQGRREALIRRFGREAGKVRGLSRFLKREGNRTEEVLTDPSSAVPLEMNVSEGGRLVWHARFAYSRDARGASTRRAIHVEHLVSEAGERVATDLELANVRLERRNQP